MLGRLFVVAMTVVLVGCGDDDEPGCGANPCGACAAGCTPVDRCTASGWDCACDCAGADASGFDAGSADGGSVDGGSVDSGSESTDAAIDAANPVACPADATGMCEPMGLQCRYGDRVCTCEPPCSGVDPGPDPPHSWACVNRPLSCPESTPTNGAPCTANGQTCTWGFCGGAMATCAAGMWVVTIIPPPP